MRAWSYWNRNHLLDPEDLHFDNKHLQICTIVILQYDTCFYFDEHNAPCLSCNSNEFYLLNKYHVVFRILALHCGLNTLK